MYILGVETQLKSSVLTYSGRVIHDVSTQWSKPQESLPALMEAASEFLSKFTLESNQRIIIETREVQE